MCAPAEITTAPASTCTVTLELDEPPPPLATFAPGVVALSAAASTRPDVDSSPCAVPSPMFAPTPNMSVEGEWIPKKPVTAL